MATEPATERRDERAALRRLVRELERVYRPSASDGERIAAERIADALRAAGAQARVERERAHGGYWWPIGLLNALGAVAGAVVAGAPAARWRRIGAVAAGAFAAAAVSDDVGGGSLWFRRRFLPQRDTWNVVAETGDRSADRTVVFVAHHDAAHSGLVFHPGLGQRGRPGPGSDRSPPILFAVWLGPVLVAAAGALASRLLAIAGATLAGGAGCAMADIGARRAVPGANDNLSAVAVIVGLAQRLADNPVRGVRVLLVSTGSEESFSEGMRGFCERHLPALSRERTEIVCLECVGSPHLRILEGEGMLRMRDYPLAAREALAAAARRAGVTVARRWRTVAATDALISLRAGYHSVTLAGVADTMLPANYHWPTDVEANLDWDRIVDALAVCEEYARGRRAADAPA